MSNLRYFAHVALSCFLLWVVQDSMGGWKSWAVVGALLGIYTTALFEGARMQRQADKGTP